MYVFVEAINKKEVKDFLLGRGDYFEWSDEGYSFHETLKTFNHLLDYAKLHSFKKMSNTLQNEILKILKTDNDWSVFEFCQLLSYIYIFVHKEKVLKEITYSFGLDPDLKTITNEKYNELVQEFGTSEEYDNSKTHEQNNAYLLNSIKSSFDILKENYGFELFD